MDKHGIEILSWPTRQQEICVRIASEKATFKIVTKTKNEEFFLEKWICHHMRISGGSRLIIFDNMSTDAAVFEIYKKYATDIFVVSFPDHMDAIHVADRFMPLYAALKESCDFFTIIDSDEFLYLHDRSKLIDDNRIVKLLKNKTDINVFIPAWVDTIRFSENTFLFNPENLYIFSSSKPIINVRMMDRFVPGTLLHHAIQLPISIHGHAPTCFVLLHMKNLHKAQRIKVNMEKLASFGIIRDSKDFATVFTCDLETLSPLHVREFVREIRSYADTHAAPVAPHAGGSDMENGLVEIGDDKGLRFFPPELKAEFIRLVNMKTDYFDLIGRFIRNSRMTLEEYLELCRARQ